MKRGANREDNTMMEQDIAESMVTLSNLLVHTEDDDTAALKLVQKFRQTLHFSREDADQAIQRFSSHLSGKQKLGLLHLYQESKNTYSLQGFELFLQKTNLNNLPSFDHNSAFKRVRWMQN